MGKRKSAKKPQTGKKMAGLDKTFRCLFCQHNGTVTCKLDSKAKTARLDCKDCAQNFSTEINHLTEPIDVYSEWIDACGQVNPDEDDDDYEAAAAAPRATPAAAAAAPAPNPRKRVAPAQGRRERDDDSDDDDDLQPMTLKKKKAVESEEEEEEAENDDD
ncbi:hypothetical protein RQP46_007762 [Phenoliferia psychrophenolica]